MLKIFFLIFTFISKISSISQECYNLYNNLAHPFHCCQYPIADTQSTTADHCYHICFRNPNICCLYDCIFHEMQHFNNGQFTIEERLKYYTADIENKKISKKIWQPVVEKTLETCEKKIAVKVENNEKCKMPEFMYMMFACEQYENFLNCPTFDNTSYFCLELKEYIKDPKSCSLSYEDKKYPLQELWFIDEIYEEGDNFDCIIWQLCCDGEARKLEAYKNPNCTVDCDKFAFVHIKAESDLNTIHYLWNFHGKISTLIAKTSKNSSLNINWDKFDGTSKAVNFSIEPEYIYSSVVNSFFLFNDTLDKGNISDPSVVNIIRFDSQNLTWTLTNITQNAGNNKITAEVQTTTQDNGSFSIMFTAYGMEKHSDELPHLYHSSDSMQVDIIANKIKSNFTNPRIAIELLTITKEDVKEGGSKINRIRNLDDEFTPGIFDVYHVLTPRSNNNTKGGFMEFRPVCYNSPNRTVSSSTELSFNNPKNLEDETDEFINSLPYMYFHKSTMTHKLKESINITLGMPNDGFYSRTNYISFSYLIGLGTPLKEGLSLFVIIFASIGLGVPLLVLLVGGSYVAVKRYRN